MENFSHDRLIKNKIQKLQDLPFAKLTATLIANQELRILCAL
jgi:hypothetical protein